MEANSSTVSPSSRAVSSRKARNRAMRSSSVVSGTSNSTDSRFNWARIGWWERKKSFSSGRSSSRMVWRESSETATPRRGMETTRPSCSSRARASRTGVRLAPRESHRPVSSR